MDFLSKKVTKSFTIKEELARRIDALATRFDVKRSQVVEHCLESTSTIDSIGKALEGSKK